MLKFDDPDHFTGILKSRLIHVLFLVLFLFCSMGANPLSARQTFPDQARSVVEGWLALNKTPLGTDLGSRTVGQVDTFYHDKKSLYHVVYLSEKGQKKGFVIVPAENRIEPIIAFFPDAAAYDPSLANPAGALVEQDLQGRMQRAMAQPDYTRDSPGDYNDLSTHPQKWEYLESIDSETRYSSGEDSISDIRIAPLVESKWSQGNADGDLCYNYYTPENYVCGCVATTMAQLMHYHRHPTDGVGTPSFTISVGDSLDKEDQISEEKSLRGGDGSGGPYEWANMVLDPSQGLTSVQRQAIGALTHDAGVAVRMAYSPGASGAWLGYCDMELVDTFGYSNSAYIYDYEAGLDDPDLKKAINPNLDAAYPVLLGIKGDAGGHAIVCDGYGYELSAMYHHLNMGWGGYQDAWYNLPDVSTDSYQFESVHSIVYNVFVTGTGEIISGRITDETGNPITGAQVTATKASGGTYSDTTDDNGIYALDKIPADSDYTISVSKTGYTFETKTSSTATSASSSIGNVWGVDFTGTERPSPNLIPIYMLLLLD